jgi:drug/metabolite transporter (DMT)-like permease
VARLHRWIPVSLSIVVAAAALLELGLRVLARLGERTRRRLVAAYAAAFAAVVLLVDESFGSIVRFYGPALLVFLVGAAARAARERDGWLSITLGLALSVGAALLQQLQVALHPVYFDHNAVYGPGVCAGSALCRIPAGRRISGGRVWGRNGSGASRRMSG